MKFGGRFSTSKRQRAKGSSTKPTNTKSNAALKAGAEGSYDFQDQFNAIIPDKTKNL